MGCPLKHFADLLDPRVEQTHEPLPEEILLITIAAILGRSTHQPRRPLPRGDLYRNVLG